MNQITWDDFTKVELRVGRIVQAEPFPQAMSECLVTGFHNEDGEVALCVPDQPVPLGTELL